MTKPVCAVVGVGPKNGQALAEKFSREGYKVALLSRNMEYLKGLATELGDAKAFSCDVLEADSIAAAFTGVENDLGPVDVLLYNAGAGAFGDLDEISDEDFERAWRVNALGLLKSARAVLGGMRERKKGAIIVTGATASLRGKPFTTAFAAAKAAQRSLAQSLARKLGPEGIHIGIVIVDGVVRGSMPGADEDFIAPEDIAETVHYLATQPRSAWTFELDVRPFKESW